MACPGWCDVCIQNSSLRQRFNDRSLLSNMNHLHVATFPRCGFSAISLQVVQYDSAGYFMFFMVCKTFGLQSLLGLSVIDVMSRLSLASTWRELFMNCGTLLMEYIYVLYMYREIIYLCERDIPLFWQSKSTEYSLICWPTSATIMIYYFKSVDC